MTSVELSVLLPAYNEADNLPEVVPAIAGALEATGRTWEIVVVDDGSTDGTRTVMGPLRSDRVRYIRLRRNSGKSAALSMGLDHVRGDVVVLMDADGQDDPSELPKLLAALDGGVDLVTGRRAVRNDRFVKRTTSVLYNGVTAKVTGVDGKDFNSGFKVMRRDVADSLEMYGELHRYIPELVNFGGFSMSEVPVNHRARVAGKSKYGLSRTFRVILDLFTIHFLRRYGDRPMQLFGRWGIILFALGALIGSYLTAIKLWAGISDGWDAFNATRIGDRPLLLLGVLLVILGVQFIVMGLLAELVVRTYYETQNLRVYRVREVLGREEMPAAGSAD